MRKLLNTLYITNPEAYLARDGENIVVKVADKEVGRRPIHILENIVCFHYTGMNGALLRLCCDHGVGVSFLDQHGNFCGRVQGKVNGNVLLRRAQYRLADEEIKALQIAKHFILGKLVNCKKTINRGLRDHADKVDVNLLNQVAEKMSQAIEHVKTVASFDSLRGIEGETARAYFQGFNELILQQKENFYFQERSKRPPRDNVNAMLSYAYTLLAVDMRNALETVGLDPYVGFLHSDRPGRAGLALDMMEELRAYLGDRFVLTLINRKQVTEKSFLKKENGGVLLEAEMRKEFITAWQKRKQDEIEHPYLQEKVEIGLIPYVQAMLMARFIRGDLDAYPPFFVS